MRTVMSANCWSRQAHNQSPSETAPWAAFKQLRMTRQCSRLLAKYSGRVPSIPTGRTKKRSQRFMAIAPMRSRCQMSRISSTDPR